MLSLARFLQDEEAATAVEYSVMLAMILLAAFAAIQDWDAVYAYDYCSRKNEWDARRIPNFFDIDQHPTKMATLPAAVAMFVRGDVQPAREQVVAPLDKEREIELLQTLVIQAGVARHKSP